MLNRNDSVPLYVQLQNMIRDNILSGRYKQGETIPSETQMMNMYDVTRTTIRKAISNLVNEGLLMQIHGKGTLVCLREMKQNIWNFSGFTDSIRKKNETPVSHVLEKQIVVENKTRFLKLVRLRGMKRETNTLWLTIDTSYIPLSLFPGIDRYDFAEQSLYNVMNRQYNKIPQKATLGIYPIIGDSRTKQLFGYEADIPLIMAKGEVFDEKGVETEKVEVIYGPNVEFKVATYV
ncbi:GntR family transcriptional regulator [Paenibacillus beijingensis]|uniref:GntR family transcriptional regulator n=1 Tax=Paenibacillus beijingensis TaxID=1126833 RepID=A0A0D5NKS2_9BACL|nr:GntR family transcriptional regulator [Paenibacillus beijingensis]AJY75851.1 GntR family transcriptional regulator [Paenibacillus beijingensis]